MTSKPESDTRPFLHMDEFNQDDIPTVPNFRRPSEEPPAEAPVGEESEPPDEIGLLRYRVNALSEDVHELSEMLIALVQLLAPSEGGSN